MATTLGNINLFVRDIARAQRFYTEVLGLTADERSAPPSFALLNAGQCTITLQDASSPDAAFGPAESVEIGFDVEDVEEIRKRILAYGLQADPVQQMAWGSALDFHDEDGHRLTIFHMRDERDR